MNEGQETVADIIAEMRNPHDEICAKCHEEPNEECPFFGDPNGCNSPDYWRWPGVMTEFADRIEAAWSRETQSLQVTIVKLSKAIADTAKMREALAEIVLLCMKVGLSIKGDVACGIIAHKAKSALAEPARNCDRFSNLHDAWLAWQAYCAEHIQDTTTKKFHVWLFDTVTRTRGDESPRTEQAISCNDAGSKKETK